MTGKTRCLVVWILLCYGLCTAGEWLDETPYTHWSNARVRSFLYKSPWVLWKGFYRVRLITARPVREAFLRRNSLVPGYAVSLEELTMDDDEASRFRLKKYIESNPDNFLVRGDTENIIVSLYDNRWLYLPMTEDGLSRLLPVAFLETDNGKRMASISVSPPSRKSAWEVQFFFKRHLPDGTPFIAEDDKELIFGTYPGKYPVRMYERDDEWSISEIKVKFDLEKMVYRGRLEY